MTNFVVSNVHIIDNDRMLIGYIEEQDICVIDKTKPLCYGNKEYPIKNLHIRGSDLIIITSGIDCPKNARIQVSTYPKIIVDTTNIRHSVYTNQRRLYICETTKKVLPSFD